MNNIFRTTWLASSTALLLTFALSFNTSASDENTPRVDGTAQAAGASVLINEVNTAAYPKVTIFTSVLDAQGVPVKDLTAADFRVREDEVDQEPLTVEPQLPPLSAVVTLDTSGSMSKSMDAAQAAAQGFVDTLLPSDSVQVVGFARKVKPLTTMISNPDSAKKAISATVARGDTALYDALYQSVELVKDREGRKAVILLSDGVDDDGTGKPLSSHTAKDVSALAKQVNVPIYVVALGSEIDEAGLSQIASSTGASFNKAPTADDLAALYQTIGTQLAGQYAISYTSNLPADGSEHRINLAVLNQTSIKSYLAPVSTISAIPSNDACYDLNDLKPLTDDLADAESRYERKLIDVMERNQVKQSVETALTKAITAQGDPIACFIPKLKPIAQMHDDKQIGILKRNELRAKLIEEFMAACTELSTQQPDDPVCVAKAIEAHDNKWIGVTDRNMVRDQHWQRVFDVIKQGAYTNTAMIDTKLEQINAMYDKGYITVLQRNEARDWLSQKDLKITN